MIPVRFQYLILAALVLAGTAWSEEPRWYKGNLHTHSLWSDGDDFPENIAGWYREQGYQFLAISDHNNLQSGDKWVKYADLYRKGAGPAVDRYLKNFAAHARTRGERSEGKQEIRLSPFAEYHSLFQKEGAFLLIPAEEISDKLEKKPVHINGINLGEAIKPQGGKSIVEIIRNNVKAINDQAIRLGRPVLPHLNHPNFQWGVTAEELAEVVEEPFFECFNGHPSINQLGDKDRRSIEKVWDVANTLRLTVFKAPPLYGIGNDDSHHYHVEGKTRAAPGRGWVMVRATSLETAALFEAMRAGDFYASSGVTLEDVRFNHPSRTLHVRIRQEGDAKYVTQFIGTRKGVNPKDDPDKVGIEFAKVEGVSPSYQMKGDELYVRAIITSDKAPRSMVLPDQKQQAWTQPVGWVVPQ